MPLADPGAVARRTIPLLDLTSLGDDDSPETIERLCALAAGAGGPPAAVCVYPEHIATARRALASRGLESVKVATVTNFPDGSADVERARRETRRAVAAGADEVDVVLPWRAWRDGDHDTGRRLLAACREAAVGRVLKVILETGELRDPAVIRAASLAALDAGADFIKTSTGKVAVNATPAAARVMLEVIRERGRGGFKAAGGVRVVSDAAVYLALADEILGPAWADAAHLRIGASALLGELRSAVAA
jgi:deoxyribose-phosphate aldolase